MAATDRSAKEAASDASAVAATCRNAELLHLVCRADGDSIAAAGLLASACRDLGTPYHVSTVRTRTDLESRRTTLDSSASLLVIGAETPGEQSLAGPGPVSNQAFEASRQLETDPDPILALAGVVAGGGSSETAAPVVWDAVEVSRRPGIAIPTDDVADGLAHTTLAHAEFSGDLEAAREAVEDLDVPEPRNEQADRHIASLLALATAGHPEASDRSGTAVERALRPLAIDGPVPTVGGYADVLGAIATEAPGLGVTLALEAVEWEQALDHWRQHARAAHEGVRSAELVRYDGLVVARTSGPVESVARLVRDFRSPEPVVVAVHNGQAGVAAVDRSVDEAVDAAAESADGSALGREARSFAQFDPDREEEFITALREAL